MPGTKDEMKALLQKKSLTEIEAMISDHKRKMTAEKNLTTLHRLTTELASMKEIHAQKLKESGRLIKNPGKQTGKPDLKSFDDYVKSKT